jgi:hypothetical protein
MGILSWILVRSLPKNLGTFLLAVWLILIGLIAVLKFSLEGLPLIRALLAIAAGVLLLLQRTEGRTSWGF